MTRIASALLLIAACSEYREPAGSSHGKDGGAADLPDPVCGAVTTWKPGQQVFKETTAEWGLDALGPEGYRLGVTDLDGDGWADLVVRRGGVKFDEPTSRGTWILRNTHAKKFEDVTAASGALATRVADNAGKGRPGEVWAAGDVDNDGDLDLYTGLSTAVPAASKGETSELLLNDGHGKFTLGPATSALRHIDGVDTPASGVFTDVDLDGNLDLWVPQSAYTGPDQGQVFQQARLYRGDGKGGFVDAVAGSGLETKDWINTAEINDGLAHANAWSGAACDLNNDGVPELLAASYGRAPNLLFQARRDASRTLFSNRGVLSGYAYDANFEFRDNEFFRCWCKANRTSADCNGVPGPRLSCSNNWNPASDTNRFRLGGNSGTTTCADLDNDGDLDLLTSEIQHWWAGVGSDHAEWLINEGQPDVSFSRPGRAAMGIDVPHTDPGGWNEGIMTNDAFDFDNDGWTDFYLGASDYAGNHGLLYHQKSLLQFEAVPIEQGIDHHRSHGVVHADFDRDGDLDVVVGHSRSRCDATAPDDCYPSTRLRFFENVTPKGNFVQIRLVGGSGTNRAAIGARVTLTAGGVTQTQIVDGGHGHFGAQNDLVLHFGLGAACTADVGIYWPNPSGSSSQAALGAGHRYVITEGGGVEADDPK